MTFGGSDTFSGSLTGSGALIVSGGTLVLNAGNSFGGAITISSAATLELASGAAGSGAITLKGTSATLRIDGTVMPTNVISGFVFPDRIDLAGVSSSSTGTAQILSGNRAGAKALREFLEGLEREQNV